MRSRTTITPSVFGSNRQVRWTLDATQGAKMTATLSIQRVSSRCSSTRCISTLSSAQPICNSGFCIRSAKIFREPFPRIERRSKSIQNKSVGNPTKPLKWRTIDWLRLTCEPAIKQKLNKNLNSMIDCQRKQRRIPSGNVARACSLSSRCRTSKKNPPRSRSLESSFIMGRGGSAHQPYEHPIKFVFVQVGLNLNRLHRDGWLILLRPGQSVAVPGSAVEVYTHVARLPFRDDRRIDPRGRCKLVPHDVGTRKGLVKVGNVMRQGSSSLVDLLDHRRRQTCLDRDVGRRAHDLLPRRAQHYMRSFRIKPEVELVTRVISELGVVGLRRDASTHEDQLLGQFGELRID